MNLEFTIRLVEHIVGTTPPPLLKEGTTFQNLIHLGGGVQNVLLEREDKPEKGGLM